MPGVVDRHVHLGLVDRSALAAGALVEVHDLGWVPEEAAGWRRTGVGGTRVRIAGAFLTPPGGYPRGRPWAPDAAVREIADVGAAGAAIRDAVALRVDAVKIVLRAGTDAFPDPVLRALVDGAHGAGLPVVAHAEGTGQADRALAAGADVLAHVPWTERLPDAVIAGHAERCTWISTLAIHAGEARAVALANARRFVAAGGRLVYGTDMGNGDGPVGVRRAEVLALGEAGLRGSALIEALTGVSDPVHHGSGEVVGDGPVPQDPAGIADWYLAATRSQRPPGAGSLDDADPLAPYRGRFVRAAGVLAYLDGNSLGRPLERTVSVLAEFTRSDWGTRLIRGWDEGWMAEPERLGDELGRVVLGAAPGRTVVGDSTSVLLYKAVRAAVSARPGRREVVYAADDFPTDRFLLQGIAEELGLRLVALGAPHDGGVHPDEVADAVGSNTAAVLLSHVAYRSAHITDVAAITAAAHAAGALTVWDLSHSAGVVPVYLDAWRVDLAVGCGYKYLNGGPGAPAFLYARQDLIRQMDPPVHGWMGAAQPFAMGERYEPDPGIRRFLSGTPPILAMRPMADMLALIDEVGVPAIRAKSERLTAFVVDAFDERFAPLGVRLATPRDAAVRGSHVTLDHPAFRDAVPALQRRGVIPDFRQPDGLRIGLSPLSTSFAELQTGLDAVHAELVSRI